MNHLMIDMETLSVKEMPVVTSLAAVEFDLLSGETGDEFYQTIDLDSALDAGFHIDSGTLQFWLSENPEYLRKCLKDSIPLENVLRNFSAFMYHKNRDIKVWASGTDFDIGILRQLYSKFRIDIPYYFRNARDARTMRFVAEFMNIDIDYKSMQTGMRHHPLDDCKYQIKWVSEIFHQLNKMNKQLIDNLSIYEKE